MQKTKVILQPQSKFNISFKKFTIKNGKKMETDVQKFIGRIKRIKGREGV